MLWFVTLLVGSWKELQSQIISLTYIWRSSFSFSTKIPPDRELIKMHHFLNYALPSIMVQFIQLAIPLIEIPWKSTLSSTRLSSGVAIHTCESVLPFTDLDHLQQENHQDWKGKAHFRKQLGRLSLDERKVGGRSNEFRGGTWECSNLGQKVGLLVQSDPEFVKVRSNDQFLPDFFFCAYLKNIYIWIFKIYNFSQSLG